MLIQLVFYYAETFLTPENLFRFYQLLRRIFENIKIYY